MNLNQLQLAAARYPNSPSFLQYTDSFQDEMVNDKEGVSLMTIHKAKGLEFPVVFIIGLVEGITLTKKGDLEEERRICFVGISRAMRLLYLSNSRTYLGQPAKKSISLDEILGVRKVEQPPSNQFLKKSSVQEILLYQKDIIQAPLDSKSTCWRDM